MKCFFKSFTLEIDYDIKQLYQKSNTKSVSKLKVKLNHAINYSEWTFDDLLIEHDYYRPEITDCIVY